MDRKTHRRRTIHSQRKERLPPTRTNSPNNSHKRMATQATRHQDLPTPTSCDLARYRTSPSH
ncbi:uncharacterized protein C8R40DRAFT_367470 [Lentinula edodes]|uniref:uncharacterized protein n=1 Tax=Lentinula edodes TaxID=5353 RepID=UPI001E8D1D47|nr:uncharacterized protein C8R40DRAFT_367470 [Lentinula edodes]KAH7873533.1 hypothetical protein C8R40DRAFT_367470 [Lentinula edodes]